jgi:signal transduction histidine kinase
MDRTDATPPPGGTTLDVGAFLRAAAHEMAGQLNAISMNAELVKLLLERSDVARADEMLKRLLGDCGRYGRMVRALGRFGSGLAARERETTGVDDLIEAATRIYAQERSGTKPVLQVDAGTATIVVDRTGMQRAIAALLHNAAEAGATAVDIHARADSESLVIAVADDGSGIPVNVRGRITQPFFTTRRDESHNGLGLTLVEEILRAHGGDISFDEKDGHGARVTLRLPLAQVSQRRP